VPYGYLRFLGRCAADSGFTGAAVADAIQSKHQLGIFKKMLYRYVVVPKVRKKLLEKRAEDAYQDAMPDYGPGRAGLALLGLPLNIPADLTHPKGGYDFMPLWNARAHAGMPVHWDGFSSVRGDAFFTASASMGAVFGMLDRTALDRLQKWLDAAQAPAYPFSVNAALADRGKSVFSRECADCHAFGGGRTGKPIPISELGTDSARWSSWPQAAASALGVWGKHEGYPGGLASFRKTVGYQSVPLDGIWARSPYLHNGSVPTLADLLLKPSLRPKVFYRGNELLDTAKVGFLSTAPDNAGRAYFRYDVEAFGNGNQGHEFGTALPDSEKTALVEYMKSL
jgi:hypothetical protein